MPLRLSKKIQIRSKSRISWIFKKNGMIKIARDHDIFINTSTIDNLPVSILEMMALGLPIISTNVGGNTFHFRKQKKLIISE